MRRPSARAPATAAPPETWGELGREKKTPPPVPARGWVGRAPRRGPSAFYDTMTPHAKNELLVVISYSDAGLVKEFAFFSVDDKDSLSASSSSTRTGSPTSFDRFAASTTARVATASS